MRAKYDRRFTGIWIPSDVWERKDLCPNEKFLLAEIDSLDGDEGCYASNEYLASVIGVSTMRIVQMLKRLRDRNLIKTESFNGRKRVMKSSLKRDVIIMQTNNILLGRDIINYKAEQENSNSNSLKDNDLQGEKKSLENSIDNRVIRKKEEKDNFMHLFPKHFQNDISFIKAWNEWLQYRKETKHTITMTSAKKQVETLSSCSIKGAISCIDKSIEMGWRGLFPTKQLIVQEPKERKTPPSNSLSVATFKLAGNSFHSYDWESLLLEHERYYEKISSVLKGRHKDFLEDRLSCCKEMMERFSTFILEKYSGFDSIEPQMLRPTGKMFQKFISNEFKMNNIPISLFKGEIADATIYTKED